MIQSQSKTQDSVLASAGYNRGTADEVRVTGRVIAEVRGPDGTLKQRVVTHNLVTDQGDKVNAYRLFGGSVTAPAGMKLGTAATTPSKNGAGSFVAVADYVAGSAQAFDATYPKQGAGVNVARYQVTWAPGSATANGISRVTITDNTTNAGEPDATHTYSAALLSPVVNKGSLDTLTVVWDVSFLGS